MEDVDAPNQTTHWLVYGIPADAAGLPNDLPKSEHLSDGILQGKNDFGHIGYTGPRQTLGVNHRYAFRLFALNTPVKLKASAGRIEFNKAIEGIILAEARLIAEYVKSVQAAPLTGAPRTLPPPISVPPWQPARLRTLNEDKEFILETARCRADLVNAHKQDSEIIEKFFHRHSLTSAFAEAKTRAYLAKIKDQNIRRVLEDYVRYANRFRVQFRLRTKPLDFKILLRALLW